MRHALLLTVLAVLPHIARAQQTDQAETSPLKPGYRAISLPFDGDRVFYLMPDDRVDVIVVYDRKERAAPKNQPAAGTLLKKVRVLDVRPSSSEPGKSVVRLEVNPTEGQYLGASAHAGDIWLALRTKGDVEDAPMEFASWNKLLESDVTVSRRDRAPRGAAAVRAGSADAKTQAAVRSGMTASHTAVSVPIESDKASFVRGGDRIDVMATLDGGAYKDGAKRSLTLTLLQNVLVLDRRKSESRPGESLLLLSLNFNEAEYAALAADTADFQVLSRAAGDEEIHPIEAASLDKW